MEYHVKVTFEVESTATSLAEAEAEVKAIREHYFKPIEPDDVQLVVTITY